MKKQLITVLILLAAALLMTGCGQKKETVEIYINVPELTMDAPAYPGCHSTDEFLTAAWNEFASRYDKYEVKLRDGKVGTFDQTAYRENIPDTYGTDRCPDLTFGGYFTLFGYVYDGRVIPLDDIITPAMKNDISSSFWDQSRGGNGKTYMLPFYSLENVLCYDRELFRGCGLDRYVSDKKEIQNWSGREWETILQTLHDRLPENHYPMFMYAKNEQGDTHLMVLLRSHGAEFFDRDGRFHLNEPKGIAALEVLKKYNERGFFPPRCENLEINDCADLLINHQLAIGLWNTALASELPDDRYGLVNFASASPGGACSNWITGFMIFDNGDKRRTEVAKDFLCYIYSHKELMDYSTGGLPASRAVTERWADRIPYLKELHDNAANAVDFTAGNPNWEEVRQQFWPKIHDLLIKKDAAAAAAAAAAIDRDCNAAIDRAGRRLHD